MNKEYINTVNKLKEENQKLLNDIHKLKNKLPVHQCHNRVYNEIPVGILLFDENLKVIDVNNTFLEIFNIKKSDICNFQISETSDKRILPAFNQVLIGHEGFYEGKYISNFKNLELFISVHAKPSVFEYNEKTIKGGIAVFRDITEDSLAERAVNKSYDTFQRVTDSVNAIIYVIDPVSFKILFMNNKAGDVFGENVGKICHKAFFNSNEQCKTCQVNILNKRNAPLGKFSGTDFYEENTKKWYQISYGYIQWVDNRKVMLLTSIDITVEKIALTKIKEQNSQYEDTLHKLTLQNEKINKQSEELQVSGAIKDTMFSIIAHDLRGPVGNITSALDIIIDDINELDKKEIIDIVKPVRDSAGAAYNLLVNLLFWAKNESGETFFIREEILLNDIIEDVLTLFKPNFETKNLTLINKINQEYYVFADEHMIHTVIRNLISNAVKYTNNEGTVEIGIDSVQERGAEYVKFWIKDDGVGISKENIDKILNSKEFFSTYGTNKEKGTGLGIILTKEFVERHNGKIEIDSSVDNGTVISIFLPVEQK
ncbi:MAG: PAS domain-containing sensor histidine kinase [Bacteroidales bacterium]|nr:PAS domain-containing sensor histidine kinase [Bacteroidales bacterium]